MLDAEEEEPNENELDEKYRDWGYILQYGLPFDSNNRLGKMTKKEIQIKLKATNMKLADFIDQVGGLGETIEMLNE